MTEWDFITNLLPIAPSVAILFFLWKSGIIKFKGENGKESKKESKNDAPLWAQELQEHFNDTTSILLGRIADGIEKLDERSERQCQKLSELIQAHEQIEKFGVKIRPKE